MNTRPSHRSCNRSPERSSGRPRPFARRVAAAATVLAASAAVLATTGCALEVQNLQPAQALAAERDRPVGSVPLGWRVYADKCAGCHGVAATGQGTAPDLLARVRELGPRGFTERVLARYDLDTLAPLAPGATAPQGAQRDAQLSDILQRRDRPLTMPAWQGEPRVNAHILDLYAYLSARADGSQGVGAPAR